MKTDRCFWIVLSIPLFWAGIHVLLGLIRHPGNYADELILIGGTLSALGLVSLFVTLKQHMQIRALARHMRLGWHPSGNIETGKKARSRYRISRSI